MKLLILSLAKGDLQEIHQYLSEFGASPPQKFRIHFEKFCSQVVAMPNMFSQYEYNTSYRIAVIIFDYLIFYKVDENNGNIMIYRVLHSKRNITPLLD